MYAPVSASKPGQDEEVVRPTRGLAASDEAYTTRSR